MSWDYQNTVLIYKSSDFSYKPSIAAFGVANTILKRSSLDKTWELASPKILEKFKLIYDKGGSIVLFSNQYGKNASFVKAKFNKLVKSLVIKSDNPVVEECKDTPIPIMAFFSLKKNCFKKPFTNLWKILNFIYQKKGLNHPDPSLSIFVGGNDGGLYLKNWQECQKNSYVRKIFKNRSDTDRAFAKNVGVRFSSAKSFFYGNAESKWNWNPYLMSVEDRIKHIKKHKDDTEPDVRKSLDELPEKDKILVIIMGPPCSGKVTISKIITEKLKEKYGEEHKVVVINDIKRNLSKKFQKEITDSLFEQSTIIITKHPDYKRRNLYIRLAHKYEMPSLIVNVKADIAICKILDQVKVQISRDFARELYPVQIYKAWTKKFEYPDYSEDNVVVMDYPLVMKFRHEMKFQYSMF